MERDPIPEELAIETDSLTVRARRPLSGLLGLGALALFLAPLVIMMVGGGLFGMSKPAHWTEILSASWIGGVIFAAIAGAARAAEMARKGLVQVAGGRLTLVRGGKRETLPEGAVLGGSVTPRIGGALLTLSLADDRIASAFVPSEAAGARALEALRIDPMGRALVGRFQSGLARSAAGFGVVFALIVLGGWLKGAVGLGTATGLVWAALCLGLGALWQLGSRPPEIAVGADGVRIRGRARARFIPLDRIRSVKIETFDVLAIELTDGTIDRTHVPLGNGPMLAAVAHRIEHATKSAGREGDEAPSTATLLARGTRTVAAWREDLRSRVKRADYRSASLEDGELEQLVGAAGASAEQRIGAALALREAGGEAARDRIRVAARQCVSPRIRVALEAIAERGDQDEIAADEEALVEAALADRAATRTT